MSNHTTIEEVIILLEEFISNDCDPGYYLYNKCNHFTFDNKKKSIWMNTSLEYCMGTHNSIFVRKNKGNRKTNYKYTIRLNEERLY